MTDSELRTQRLALEEEAATAGAGAMTLTLYSVHVVARSQDLLPDALLKDDTLPLYFSGGPVFKVGFREERTQESRPSGRGGRCIARRPEVILSIGCCHARCEARGALPVEKPRGHRSAIDLFDPCGERAVHSAPTLETG